MGAAISSQLVHGNQPLFDKCANGLAKKKYDGDRIASMVLTIESIVNGES